MDFKDQKQIEEDFKNMKKQQNQSQSGNFNRNFEDKNQKDYNNEEEDDDDEEEEQKYNETYYNYNQKNPRKEQILQRQKNNTKYHKELDNYFENNYQSQQHNNNNNQYEYFDGNYDQKNKQFDGKISNKTSFQNHQIQENAQQTNNNKKQNSNNLVEDLYEEEKDIQISQMIIKEQEEFKQQSQYQQQQQIPQQQYYQPFQNFSPNYEYLYEENSLDNININNNNAINNINNSDSSISEFSLQTTQHTINPNQTGLGRGQNGSRSRVLTMNEQISEKCRHIIDTTFQHNIIKYGKKIFHQIEPKENDIKYFESVIKKFKFSYKYTNLHLKRESFKKHEGIYYDDNQFEDKPVNYLIHDSNITPFYFKVNPVTIYFNLDHNKFITEFLEELDTFLREVLEQNYSILNFSNKSYSFQRRLEFEFLKGENDPPTKFIIRAGTPKHNTGKYLDSLISTYTDFLNDRFFEQMSAFLLYWGLKRGIINDEYLNEYAFYILIIYFCQINGLLPILNEYKKDTLLKVMEINKLLQEKKISKHQLANKLQEDLNDSDYFIHKGKYNNPSNKYGRNNNYSRNRNQQQYNNNNLYQHNNKECVNISIQKNQSKSYCGIINQNQNIIEQLIPLDFPKKTELNKIRKQFKKQNNNDSLGYLVTRFFYTMAYEVPNMNKCVCIDGKPVFLDCTQNCRAGYSILNPIIQNNLTEKLYYNSEGYNIVQSEFERAFFCVSEQKTLRFKDLCTQYKP